MRLLLMLLLLLAPLRLAAQEIPACNQDRVGAVACMAGKLCACGYARGGIVSGRPDGYRWDCGALRPACGAPAPADLPGFAQQPPPFYLQLAPPEGQPPRSTPFSKR
jgi:hypothetical protein